MKKKRKKPNSEFRITNSYNLFFRHHSERLNHDGVNNFIEKNRRIADMWRSLKDEEKEPWRKMADEDRQQKINKLKEAKRNGADVDELLEMLEARYQRKKKVCGEKMPLNAWIRWSNSYRSMVPPEVNNKNTFYSELEATPLKSIFKLYTSIKSDFICAAQIFSGLN